MITLNIQHGFSQYSSEEPLDRASQGSPQGLLFCGETDLQNLIDKLFDADYAVGYEEGFEAGKHEGQTICWECLEEI